MWLEFPDGSVVQLWTEVLSRNSLCGDKKGCGLFIWCDNTLAVTYRIINVFKYTFCINGFFLFLFQFVFI